MSDGWYSQAQICEAGHITNVDIKNCPECNENFCSQCNAPTIVACTKCGKPIRGVYHAPGLLSTNNIKVPAYCYNCGEPYPWTKSSLEAIQEILKLEQNDNTISANEATYLEENLKSLAYDGPKAQLIALKFKSALNKIKGPSLEILHDALIEIASETASKILFPH